MDRQVPGIDHRAMEIANRHRAEMNEQRHENWTQRIIALCIAIPVCILLIGAAWLWHTSILQPDVPDTKVAIGSALSCVVEGE